MTESWGRIIVPTPGTPISAIANFPDPAAVNKFSAVNAVLIQVLPTNTGRIYIGKSQSMDKASWVDVIAWLAIPTVNFSPSCSITIPYAVGGVEVKDLWIDADNAGEGVIISSVSS